MYAQIRMGRTITRRLTVVGRAVWTGRKRTVWILFFRAEDGIRDGRVTGVQTCALPICRFGLGGIYVEVFRDVTFRLAPIRELGAQRMVESIKAGQILRGVRGRPPADVEALLECIERLSQLAVEVPEIAELDINPLLVLAAGQGAAVVDARLRLLETAPNPSDGGGGGDVS